MVNSCENPDEAAHYELSRDFIFCTFNINPIALRKAKIVCNFGISECNRVKEQLTKFMPAKFQKCFPRALFADSAKMVDSYDQDYYGFFIKV